MNFSNRPNLSAKEMRKIFDLSATRTNCYLCGVQLIKGVNQTRDHVPAKGLFPDPLPADLMTVAACRDCNNSTSDDEEFFRLVAATGLKTTPEAQNIWQTKVVPNTIKGGRAKERLAELVASFQKVTVIENGRKKEADAFTVPRDLFDRIAAKIARGILAYLNPAMPTHRVPLQMALLRRDNFLKMALELPVVPKVKRGGSTFEFIYGTQHDHPKAGLLMFSIYRRIHAAAVFDDPDNPAIFGIPRPMDYLQGSILEEVNNDPMADFI